MTDRGESSGAGERAHVGPANGAHSRNPLPRPKVRSATQRRREVNARLGEERLRPQNNQRVADFFAEDPQAKLRLLDKVKNLAEELEALKDQTEILRLGVGYCEANEMPNLVEKLALALVCGVATPRNFSFTVHDTAFSNM